MNNSTGPDHRILDYSQPYTHVVLELGGRTHGKVVWTVGDEEIPDHQALKLNGMHIHAWQDMFIALQVPNYFTPEPVEHIVTATVEGEQVQWTITIK